MWTVVVVCQWVVHRPHSLLVDIANWWNCPSNGWLSQPVNHDCFLPGRCTSRETLARRQRTGSKPSTQPQRSVHTPPSLHFLPNFLLTFPTFSPLSGKRKWWYIFHILSFHLLFHFPLPYLSCHFLFCSCFSSQIKLSLFCLPTFCPLSLPLSLPILFSTFFLSCFPKFFLPP